MDKKDVRSADIVPTGLLNMVVWNTWQTVVDAVATNEIALVFKLGVTADSDYTTPVSSSMTPAERKNWFAERAFIALYIAAHRGHYELCTKLLATGANVNGRTSLGHTPLHVAAGQGRGQMVDLLLHHGADIDAVDNAGDNALAVACRFGHKDCERHLFLFRWQQRAKHTKPQEEHPLFAHQYYDSSLRIAFSGTHAQFYCRNILPRGEFQGTTINAPSNYELVNKASSSMSSSSSDNEDEVYSPSGFSDGNVSSHTGNARGRVSQYGPRRYSISFPNLQVPGKRLTAEELRHKQKKALKRARKYGTKKTVHPEGFESWLEKKQAVEQVSVERHRKAAAISKLVEEDRKRQQDFQDKSYDQWLVDKETKKESPGVGIQTQSKIVALPPAAVLAKKSAANLRQTTTPVVTPLDMKELIQVVVSRREDTLRARGVMSYEDWLRQPQRVILEQIRAGSTPLENAIQQCVTSHMH